MEREGRKPAVRRAGGTAKNELWYERQRKRARREEEEEEEVEGRREASKELQGKLAFDMITSEDVWRCILEFL